MLKKILAILGFAFAESDLLDAEYRAMAADSEREAEAMDWCNALIGDVAEETSKLIET